MNLAAHFDNENLTQIGKTTKDIVDNLIYLDKYKDCKAFVNFANKTNVFERLLCLLEFFYNESITFDSDISCDYFDVIIKIFDQKICEVKNYPHKGLKKKYLRLSDGCLEIFDFFKSRYFFIKSDSGEMFKNRYKEFLKDDNITFHTLNLENVPIEELSGILLGLVYENYWAMDADFLVPIVKKYIRNAYYLLKKNNIEVPQSSFEEQIYVSSKTYRKALIELAK